MKFISRWNLDILTQKVVRIKLLYLSKNLPWNYKISRNAVFFKRAF